MVLILVFATNSIVAYSQASTSDESRRLVRDAVAHPADKDKVNAFLSTLIEMPPGSGRYIVEGDIVISGEEMNSYLKGLRSPELTQVKSQELVVNLVGGKLDYLMSAEKRQLTYKFESNSFPSAQAYEFTKANFRKAADDWTAACPECGITFSE